MIVYLMMFFLSEIAALISTHFSLGQNSVNLIYQKKYLDVNGLLARFFLWLSVIPFLFVAAARYRVGTDYSVYLDMQIPQLLKGIDYKLEYEYLYQYLIKIGVSLGNTQWVFILTHVVLLFFLWESLKNLSADRGMSIFIFMFGAFYNMSLNIMRQFIAMAIFMYAIKYIINRKIFIYFALIIVAFMFHKSAMVFIPLYWLSRIKINDFVGLALIPSSVVLSEIIRRLLVKITNFLGIYSNYFNGQFDSADRQWDFIIFNLILLLLMIFIRNFVPRNEPEKLYQATNITKTNSVDFETLLFNLQIVATIVSALSSIIPNSTRIIFMFSIGQILYFPYLLKKVKNKNYRLVFTLIIILVYVTVFIRLIVIKNIGDTLPYTFF
ncbi:EpsG family protein (plasmid) [Companilactobacillus farciminis]|uniref:EpsG family protein n=1 Tax=Companilactobacillus farciminis TaxID=1612 RepID=UPI0034D71FC0